MISVIIPTLNEEGHIGDTVHYLRESVSPQMLTEIIVVDGGSTDRTIRKAKKAGAQVLISAKKGRSAQMNFGALYAKGDILYFLHADTLPPPGFDSDIANAVTTGYPAGCFKLSFNYEHWFLKANCWFTRFDFDAFRFGDQSLFVKKATFKKSGGFCEKHLVLEDQEIIVRLKNIGRFTVVQKQVLTSARTYLQNGIYKTQAVYFLIYMMYRLGVSQSKLLSIYKKLVLQDKYG